VKLRSNQAATAGWNNEVGFTRQSRFNKQRYGYLPAQDQSLDLASAGAQ
jgi:hypothetical protein